jgi:hypothetical protein
MEILNVAQYCCFCGLGPSFGILEQEHNILEGGSAPILRWKYVFCGLVLEYWAMDEVQKNSRIECNTSLLESIRFISNIVARLWNMTSKLQYTSLIRWVV